MRLVPIITKKYIYIFENRFFFFFLKRKEKRGKTLSCRLGRSQTLFPCGFERWWTLLPHKPVPTATPLTYHYCFETFTSSTLFHLLQAFLILHFHFILLFHFHFIFNPPCKHRPPCHCLFFFFPICHHYEFFFSSLLYLFLGFSFSFLFFSPLSFNARVSSFSSVGVVISFLGV